MKNKYILCTLILFLLLSMFYGCTDRQDEDREKEAEIALASLDQSRPENGDSIPGPAADIEDIRITILDREYFVPSYMEDFQNLSMMQILYGYYSDGVWNDYPSENYNLIGIMQNSDSIGWEACIGSHMVRIGQYLLINICVCDDPLGSCVISDTLSSPIQEPFSQYYTYQYYVDLEGSLHSYMENHSSGYGYLAENPNRHDTAEDVDYTIVPEFRQRYYLILDFASIPDDYRLTLSVYNKNNELDEYTLTASMIAELIK